MVDETTIAELAQCLDEAERTRVPVRILTVQRPELTTDDAYAIQRAWTALKIGRGRSVKGHKIGLTSRATQSALGASEPDHGPFFDDSIFFDGATISFARFREPRIEVELAFVLDVPLRGPGCTSFDVLAATRCVVPALEILDTRMPRIDPETRAARTVVDAIADNATNAAVVMGTSAFRPLAVDLRWVSALLFRNGRIEQTGVAAAVMNHPAHSVAWLANELARTGGTLPAGHIVLSGCFAGALELRPGDTIHADYGPHGSIACRFE